MSASSRKLFIRLIPVIMQLAGFAGLIAAIFYSLTFLLGSGIGSPTGKPSPDLYPLAAVLISIPALLLVSGWIWVTVGFLKGARGHSGPSA